MAVFTLQGQQAAAQPISSCVCTQTCWRDAPHFGPNVDGSVRGLAKKIHARVYRRPPFSNWVWKMSRSWNLLFSLSRTRCRLFFSLPHLADKKLISSLTQHVLAARCELVGMIFHWTLFHSLFKAFSLNMCYHLSLMKSLHVRTKSILDFNKKSESGHILKSPIIAKLSRSINHPIENESRWQFVNMASASTVTGQNCQ
jgi:hypothetical protein